MAYHKQSLGRCEVPSKHAVNIVTLELGHDVDGNTCFPHNDASCLLKQLSMRPPHAPRTGKLVVIRGRKASAQHKQMLGRTVTEGSSEQVC